MTGLRDARTEPHVTKQETAVEIDSVKSPRIEQRRSRRFSTTLDVEIYWHDEYRVPCVLPAVVKNVSAGGFGNSLGRKSPVVSLLTVGTPQTSMPCVVRQVHPDHGAFLIGVALLPIRDGTTPTPTS